LEVCALCVVQLADSVPDTARESAAGAAHSLTAAR